MSDCLCSPADGPCVCDELDEFLTAFGEVEIMQGCEITEERLEISKGIDLDDNQQYLNLEFISPDDPTDRVLMSLTKAAAIKLLDQVADCAVEIWGDLDE